MAKRGAHPRRRLVSDGGFTVAEIVVAISILFVVCTAVMGALAFATDSEAMTVRRQTALDMANAQIERAKSMNYEDVGVVGGNPPGQIPAEQTNGAFTIATDVQRMWETVAGTQTASTYKNISVSVSWDEPIPGHVTVQSAIFGRDSYANVSDLSVHVVNGDDPDASMQGAMVGVDPSIGAPQLQYADPSSNARFGRLPSGLTAVNVDFPPYIFDIEPYQTLNLVPATLTEITITGWRASDVTIHVTDSAGQNVSGAEVLFNEDQPATTDSSGNAVFDGLLPNGLAGTPDNYSYSVKVPGYDTILGQVPAFAHGGSHITVEVVVPAISIGRLTMRVYSTQTGLPLQGATVTCSKPTLTTKTSDSNGEVHFDVVGTNPIPGAVITPTLTGYTGSAITTTLVPSESRTGQLPMTPQSSKIGTLRIYTQKNQRGTYVPRGPYWIRITNTTTGRVLYRWVYPYTDASTGTLVISVPSGYAYRCEAYAMRRSRWQHWRANETPTTPWPYAPTQRTARNTSTVVGAGTTVNVYIRW